MIVDDPNWTLERTEHGSRRYLHNQFPGSSEMSGE